MPPSDPIDKPYGGPSMGSDSMPMPSGSEMEQAPSGDGSVMIEMPKKAFDDMHALVQQLASGLEQLAQTVNSQASGKTPSPEIGSGEMSPSAPATAPAKGGKKPALSDEEFLNELAQQGNR